MKYRSRTEIVAQILDAASERITRTRIMYKAFLSHAQLKEYLNVLEQNGLLAHDEKDGVYRISAKGLDFLKLYQDMGELVLDRPKQNENKSTSKKEQEITSMA